MLRALISTSRRRTRNLSRSHYIHYIHSMSQKAGSDDEYAGYDDFVQFTEEDFAQVDAQISTTLKKGVPKYQIEVEPAEQRPEPKPELPPSTSNPSPLQRFRRNKVLSVTDLVSPAWCEFQFDYGLRQKRSRKLEYRPDSFTSESGKKIVVDNQVAIVNDQITKSGKSVHKKLEQDIRPEEVTIDITTDEERWALRVLNMISSFDILVHLGYSREIPVFGIVRDQVIIGVIDEVRRLPVSGIQTSKRPLVSPQTTPRKLKKSRTMPSPSQKPITAFLSLNQIPSSGTSSYNPSPIEAPTRHSLHLVDIKTRRRNSLPDDDDTISSRLQLMLYSRLLTDLLGPFDFAAIWQKLNLDANRSFSQTFLSQMKLLVDSSISVKCLHDVGELWTRTATALGVVGVDPLLQLIYRLQPPKGSSDRKRRTGDTNGIPVSALKAKEDEDIARAIAASLADLHASKPDVEGNSESDSTMSPTDGGNTIDDPELELAIQLSLLIPSNGYTPQAKDENAELPSGSDNPLPQPLLPPPEEAPIIGTKEFTFDGKFLEEYLQDVLQWWTGARKPRGVSLQQTWRCSSCEYRQGCEWREQKAKELEESLRRRKQ
ncbi:hypothetical protein D9758_002158 [Tetrapyrgos nigripes]|uniref:Exonuclease V n=1 Tax=Tetrapyrgos nigripes TaxID=182062 RepID=A0A8H5GP52_9AGAR|nr:hypothetical protein D9758_002158 [Tetrapyrgos nigripes]